MDPLDAGDACITASSGGAYIWGLRPDGIHGGAELGRRRECDVLPYGVPIGADDVESCCEAAKDYGCSGGDNMRVRCEAARRAAAAKRDAACMGALSVEERRLQ